MTIKVKSTSAKEATVSITVDKETADLIKTILDEAWCDNVYTEDQRASLAEIIEGLEELQ